jgi:hypothetical protein
LDLDPQPLTLEELRWLRGPDLDLLETFMANGLGHLETLMLMGHLKPPIGKGLGDLGPLVVKVLGALLPLLNGLQPLTEGLQPHLGGR